QKRVSVTTVTSSAGSPSVSGQGQTVKFTAVVADSVPGVGIPTGTVTFTIDGVPRATLALTTVGGVQQASFALSTLSLGFHNVGGTYGGNGISPPTTSAPLVQEARKTSTPALVSSATPSQPNQPVVFTATVRSTTPGQGIPTGTVTFRIDGVDQQPPVPLTVV